MSATLIIPTHSPSIPRRYSCGTVCKMVSSITADMLSFKPIPTDLDITSTCYWIKSRWCATDSNCSTLNAKPPSKDSSMKGHDLSHVIAEIHNIYILDLSVHTDVLYTTTSSTAESATLRTHTPTSVLFADTQLSVLNTIDLRVSFLQQ